MATCAIFGLAVPTSWAYLSTAPTWPISGTISQLTGSHKGIDVAAPVGTLIFAAAGGVVLQSEWDPNGYGCNVIVDHGNGWKTQYAHMAEVWVSPETEVFYGITVLGRSGGVLPDPCAGQSTGGHLHFEFRVGSWPGAPQTGWDIGILSVGQATVERTPMPAFPAGFPPQDPNTRYHTLYRTSAGLRQAVYLVEILDWVTQDVPYYGTPIGSPAVTRYPWDDTLQIVYRVQSGGLGTTVYVPGQGWATGPISGTGGASGSPSIAARGNYLELAYTSTNSGGGIRRKVYDPFAGGWQAAEWVPSSRFNNQGVNLSGPAIATWGGNVNVDFRVQGGIRHQGWIPGAGWQAHTDLGGDAANASGAPTAVEYLGGYHLAYLRSGTPPNAGIRLWNFTPGSGWRDLGTVNYTGYAVGAPTLATYFDQLHMEFPAGAPLGVYSIAYIPSWQGWANLGIITGTQNPAATSDPGSSSYHL